MAPGGKGFLPGFFGFICVFECTARRMQALSHSFRLVWSKAHSFFFFSWHDVKEPRQGSTFASITLIRGTYDRLHVG